MYLSGDAPTPGEYSFLDLSNLHRELPPDLGERVLLAVDCANERRIGPEPTPLRGREARRRTSTTTTTTRAFGAVNLVVADASSTAEIVRDVLRELDVPLTPEIAAALYVGPRHGHRALPVHEHDPEVAPARRRARRGRRRRARHLPARLRDRAVRQAEAARPRARARPALRGRPAGRLVSPAGRLRRRRRRGALLGGDHRLPPSRRRLGDGRADSRAAAERRPGAPHLAALVPRRGRRLCDRPRVRRGWSPSGRGLLVGTLDRRDHRLHPPPVRARQRRATTVPPRSLKPVGVALVDKPAGPSSFAIVAMLRRRTRARTGHAGTLDPFATGLLVLLSGAATRLAPCFVEAGQAIRHRRRPDLDDVDRRSRRRAGRGARGPAAAGARRGARTASRRGGASDPPSVRGEDRRRAGVQAGAARRGRGDAAAALARALARRDHLHGSERDAWRCTSAQGPTSVRSPRRSTATARRCGAPRSGRSRSEEAAEVEHAVLLPVGEGARAPACGGSSSGCPRRSGRACSPWPSRAEERLRERRTLDRAISSCVHARSRSGRSTACTSVTGRSFAPPWTPGEARGSCRRPSRSIRTRGRCSGSGSSCSRRSSGGSSCSRRPGWRTCSSSSSRPSSLRSSRRSSRSQVLLAIGAKVVVAGTGFRFGKRRAGDLELLRQLGLDARQVPLVEGVSSTRIRQLAQAGEVEDAARLLGRPLEVEGTVVGGDRRGGTLGFPTANLDVDPEVLVPGFGIYAGAVGRPSGGDLDRRQPALRRHRAPHRGVPARLERRSLR